MVMHSWLVELTSQLTRQSNLLQNMTKFKGLVVLSSSMVREMTSKLRQVVGLLLMSTVMFNGLVLMVMLSIWVAVNIVNQLKHG